MNKRSKFLVTGCRGFLGSHWTAKLLNEGHKVVGIDIKSDNYNFQNSNNFKFYKRTITDEKFLEKIIKNVDYVCHLAAIANPQEYITQPAKVINLDALNAINIVNLSIKHKKKLIFTSSSEIYGKSPKIPFKESDDRVLGSADIHRWCYSTSKALVEHYLFAMKEEKKIEFISFRLFNVYGPRLTSRVMPIFIDKFMKNNNVEILGTGKNTRTYMYVDDCIDAFYKTFLNFNKMKNEIYNIGTNFEISSIKLAKKIKKLLSSKSKIIFINSKKLKKKGYEDIPRRIPSTKKLRSMINWAPKINIDEGLKLTIKYIIENEKKNQNR